MSNCHNFHVKYGWKLVVWACDLLLSKQQIWRNSPHETWSSPECDRKRFELQSGVVELFFLAWKEDFNYSSLKPPWAPRNYGHVTLPLLSNWPSDKLKASLTSDADGIPAERSFRQRALRSVKRVQPSGSAESRWNISSKQQGFVKVCKNTVLQSQPGFAKQRIRTKLSPSLKFYTLILSSQSKRSWEYGQKMTESNSTGFNSYACNTKVLK